MFFSTLAMHFSNRNSDVVKRTGSRKCHIELATGKAGGNLYMYIFIYSNTTEPLTFILIYCHSKCGFDRKSSSAQFGGNDKIW